MNSTPPPADKLLEYETHYAALDVRMPLFWSVSEGELMLDHEHLSPSSFNREPIYTEFLASVGMRHTACIPARDGKDSRDFVGFMRHLDQRPYGTAERAVLEFSFKFPGMYMFHAHQSEFAELGWMGVFDVREEALNA